MLLQHMHREAWIDRLKALRTLDSKRVTDDERRMAVLLRPDRPAPMLIRHTGHHVAKGTREDQVECRIGDIHT